MSQDKTLFQNGQVRAYRGDVALDPDLDSVLLDVGDGLNHTQLSGNRNSYRQSDGDGALVVRRIVRGDGVNTLLADSGALATSSTLLGMVVATDGTLVRVATNGSIVDGFAGLTKHAVYYLGAAGAISLAPGVVSVQVGIAVSTTELLLTLPAGLCSCDISLEKCFSSAFFDCDEGAGYLLYGAVAGEKVPALEFAAGVDNLWYCGFPTPNDMDVTQAATLELRMAAPSVHPAVNTNWILSYRSVLATQNVFTGGVSTVLLVQNAMPAAQHTMITLSYPIPANTLVTGAINRQTLRRQGSVDTYLGSMNLVAATLKYAHV